MWQNGNAKELHPKVTCIGSNPITVSKLIPMGHRKKKIRPRPFVLDEMGQSTYTISGSAQQQAIWLRDPSAFLREPTGINLRDPLTTAFIEAPIRFVNPLEGAEINFIDPEPVMKPKTFLQKAKDFIMATMTLEYYSRLVDQMFKEYTRRKLVLQEEAKLKEQKRKDALELKGVYRDRLKALTDENIALKYENEQLKKKLCVSAT